MKHETVRASAFAMPLTNPAFPAGPYRFVNREYFIIQHRTNPEALRRIVPEPLELTEPVMNYEFIRMPDSTGFGDYTESGQVIPVCFRGQGAIADLARHRSYNIIHLIYQSKIYEGQSKDYEFGLSAMRAHWQSGLEEIRRTLSDRGRLDPPPPEVGIVTHDIHRRD